MKFVKYPENWNLESMFVKYFNSGGEKNMSNLELSFMADAIYDMRLTSKEYINYSSVLAEKIGHKSSVHSIILFPYRHKGINWTLKNITESAVKICTEICDNDTIDLCNEISHPKYSEQYKIAVKNIDRQMLVSCFSEFEGVRMGYLIKKYPYSKGYAVNVFCSNITIDTEMISEGKGQRFCNKTPKQIGKIYHFKTLPTTIEALCDSIIMYDEIKDSQNGEIIHTDFGSVLLYDNSETFDIESLKPRLLHKYFKSKQYKKLMAKYKFLYSSTNDI